MKRRDFFSRVVIVLLSVAMMVSIVGCGAKKTAPANDGAADGGKVIKVGMLGPFTGPSARVGEEFKQATDMAFSAIDYKIGDYTIEFVYADSESDAEKAARAYERVITQDQVDVGFMDWHSWVSVSCMEIAAKYKIPHFFSFGAGVDVNNKYDADPEKYKYWVGKGWPLPEKLTAGYVETVIEAIDSGLWEPANRNFAVYGVDQDWGRQFGDAVKKQFEDAGWTCVAEEWVQLGETEFYPLLNKIKSKEASLLIGTMSDPPAVSSFIKQSKEVNLDSLIICDGVGWVGEWYELTGDASNYVIDQIPQWATPEAKAFAEEFKGKFGTDPGPSTAGMCYDLANYFIKVLKTTLETYGEITTETLTKCAEEKVITGELTYTDGIIHSEYKYTPETFPDPVVGSGYYMFPVIQYMDGETNVVWPADQKNSELQIEKK